MIVDDYMFMREVLGATAGYNQISADDLGENVRAIFMRRFDIPPRSASPTPSEVSTVSHVSTASSRIFPSNDEDEFITISDDEDDANHNENGQRYSEEDINAAFEQQSGRRQQPQHGEQTCTICQESARHLYVQLRCGHQFCYGCVDAWAEYSRTCPNCRRSFDIAELRTVRTNY